MSLECPKHESMALDELTSQEDELEFKEHIGRIIKMGLRMTRGTIH